MDQIIDARGLAVTPGAIDLRSSVAGYGHNYLRLWGALPSPRQLGESYALLGYTHIHEPYLTVATANYVHHELAAIPIVDTSASLTLNLRDFDLWLRDAAHVPGTGCRLGLPAGTQPGPQSAAGGAVCPISAGFLSPSHLSLEAVLDEAGSRCWSCPASA